MLQFFKVALFLGFLIWPSGSWAASQVFFIDFSIPKQGKVITNVVRVVEGTTSFFEPTQTNAVAVLISLDNLELARVPFFVGYTIFEGPADEPELDVARLALRLPYYLTARKVDLFKDNKQVGEINLEQWLCSTLADRQCSEFCKLKGRDPDCRQCGNGLCESGENIDSCALDCSAAVVSIEKTGGGGPYVLAIILGLIVAFGAGGFWLYSRRRR